MSAPVSSPFLKNNVGLVTIVLTVVGYALVALTFEGMLPIYPDIGETEVNMLGHAIAVVNSVATVLLIAGWYWIRQDAVEKHMKAMGGAFGLIVLFLLLYLPKVGGGGEKHIAGAPGTIELAYFIMLAIHIIVSVIAMPVVLYALLLGMSHTEAELKTTAHARVGRIAAGAWIVSLVLGVVTYIMLNHVYTYEFAPL